MKEKQSHLKYILYESNRRVRKRKVRPVRLKSDERRNIISHSALLV